MELTSLKEKLDERRSNFAQKASDHVKRIYEAGVDAVLAHGTTEAAKNVGDQAPPFSLKNALGDTVSLESYLEKGPVVLTWYRGGWCPYCNLALQFLQSNLPAFKAEGANLLALTPEVSNKSLSTSEKNELQFEVLSDVGNRVARQYGLVFKLIEEVAENYQQNFDLHGYNGDESDELPIAATYVIDQQGQIAYAFIDHDYRNRAEPTDILAALRQLNS